MSSLAHPVTVASASRSEVSVSAPVVLIGRLLFALIFLMSGPMHFSSQTITYAASQGVPLASIAVSFSGLLALVGGLYMLLRYRARIGAWLIAVFMVLVTSMHNFCAVNYPMLLHTQL